VDYWWVTFFAEDQLTEELALVDGYVSFFSYSKKKAGYSGM